MHEVVGLGRELRKFSYISCNAALNRVFFDGRFAGQPVYLTLDNDMREEVANALELEPEDLERAICSLVGTWLGNSGNPYEDTVSALQLWRRTGMKSPPLFTGILFCLSHAASLMAAQGEFASNNYYLRLAQVTGIDLQRLKQNGKSTEGLWTGLRDWLLQNNHALGKPSAVATSTWVYVGKAMSQAVVRASDRAHFHDLFEKFGFTGNEELSIKEMEHYLSYWIATTGPHQRLRKVWRNPDLHERVAEAAIAELGVWGRAGSTTRPEVSQRPARLSLIADLVPRFPRTVLELHLGRTVEGDDSNAYKLPGDPEKFFLSNETFGSVSTISPSPFGPRGEGLGNSFAFRSAAQGAVTGLEWQPKIIIPLAMRPQTNLWMEALRVSFGTPHMLLVRDTKDLPAQVERYLAGVCTKPPSRANSEQLPGLAPGWVLYQGVEIRKIAEPPSEDLECLMPLGSEGTLEIVGGLQLVPNFYHSSTQPVANFVSPGGPVSIVVSGEEDGDEVTSARSDDGECSLQLEARQFAGSAYVHAFQEGQRKPSRRQVFFRNANKPQPLSQSNKGRLSYRSILSASQVSDDMPTSVEGMSVRADVDRLLVQDGWAPASLPKGEGEALQLAVHTSALQARGYTQVCVERGYHVTVLPEVPSNTPGGTPFTGMCRSCKRPEIVIYRRRLKGVVGHALPRLELPSVSATAPGNQPSIDYATLVDALCFLGQGNWARLQSIIGHWGEGATHPRQVAHELFLLGLIDLELKPGTNSIRAWSVPPASINYTSSSDAFLAGFRSRSLLAEIKALVRAEGGELVVQEIARRPSLVTVNGMEPAALARAIGAAIDPLFRAIDVNDNAGSRLASSCDLLQGFGAALVPASIGRARNLQRFDTANARWSDVEMAHRAGAYRWNNGVQCYAYQYEDGDAVAGPYQVIKAIAANQEGRTLHMYDRTSRKFLSTLGCEPPGLLERSLVACSGHLPEILKGISTYHGVGPEVAAQVLKHIHIESLDHEERQSNQRH